MRTKYLFLSCLFFTSVLFLPNATAQNYSQWSLPEGAKARLGKGTIREVKLSPDGTLLAVASSIGVWLYDARTGEELVLLAGHTQNVNNVAFSSDGKILASGSADFTIRLWEVSTGTHLKTLKGHTGIVTSLCFFPDSRTLASADWNSIRLWRVAYGTSLKTLKADLGAISIASSDDGRTLASVNYDKAIDLWDAVSGEHIKTLNVDAERIGNIVFSGDGKTFASTSDGIHLWDTFSGEHIKTLKRDTKLVSSVAFSRDGNTLASASEDEIYLWDTTSSTHSKTLTGHTDSIISLDFSGDGKTLVSTSEVEVCLWDAISGKHLKTLTGHTKKVTNIAFSGHFLTTTTLASTSEKEIYLWNAVSATKRETLRDHTEDVSDIAFSGGDANILASASGKEIYLWDTVSGERREIPTGHTKSVLSVAFSGDGKTLASTSGKEIYLWDVTSGTQRKTLIGHTEVVNNIAFADSFTILAGKSGKEIHLWDADTGKYLKTLTEHAETTFNITSSIRHDLFGNHLLASVEKEKIYLWRIPRSGESRVSRRTFTTENTEIKIDPIGVALGKSGKILASIDDNKIHLWDVASGTQRKTLIGHTQDIYSVAFNDDNTLASASEDGTVILWNTNIRRLQKPQLKKEDISQKGKASTVVVIADVWNPKGGYGTRLGSGFVLPIFGGPSNMIATNYHVVKHLFNDDVVFDSYVRLVHTTKRYKIKEIVGFDEKNDLAILKIDGIIDSLALGDSNEVESGMSVYVVGHPEGREGTFSDGVVSNASRAANRIQITAPISGGSSGGPVLNSKGEVIGVVVATAAEERLELVRDFKGEVVDITVRKVPIGQNLNFAIPSNALKELIKKVKGKK